MPTDSYEFFYADLGRRVRRAREQAGVNQTDMARRLGMTRSSVSNLEAGRQRPPMHILALIARTTGVPWAELLPEVADLAAPSTASAFAALDEKVLESVRLVVRRASEQSGA